MTIDDRDDIEYWNALADRVAATTLHRARADVIGWLAQSRAAWVIIGVLAGSALAFVMNARGAAGVNEADEWKRAIAPIDNVGRAVVLDRQPPAIGALLVDGQSRRPR